MSGHFFTHIDTDGLDAIYQAHGVSRRPGRDGLFHSASEASSEFFRRNGICATYFVIAEDLDDPERRAALRAVADAGHGIASQGGVPNEKIKAFVDALPVARLTTFDDISNVFDFFLLDSSEAVAGQVIYLNGMPNVG